MEDIGNWMSLNKRTKKIHGSIIIHIPFRKFNLIMFGWLLIWQHSQVLAHTQKALLILSQRSIWLHPCTVQLWSLTRLCEQTRNMYYVACHPFTLMLWMSAPTLQLFDTAGYNHPMPDVALHGTSMHFCRRERLFACMNAVPLYGLLVVRKVTCTVMFVHKMLFTPVSILSSSDGNIYKYCHVLSNIYSSFPVVPHFWPNGSCHDLWSGRNINSLYCV